MVKDQRSFFRGNSKRIQTHTFLLPHEKSDLQRRRRRRLLNFFFFDLKAEIVKILFSPPTCMGENLHAFLGEAHLFLGKIFHSCIFFLISLRNPTPNEIFLLVRRPLPFSPPQPTLRCLGKRTKKRGRKSSGFPNTLK